MKKSLSTACFFAIVLLALVSCKRNGIVGEGDVTTEHRNVNSFSRISISAKLDAVVHVDSSISEPELALDGYRNILEHIKTEVRDNTLYIETKERLRIRSDRDITATIRMPAVSAIKLSGAGDIKVHGNAKSDNLDMTVSGAGNVVIDHLVANTFSAHMSGVGDLTIKEGSAGHADMSISGAGEIDAENFVCNTARIKVSGIGDVSVNVQQNLEARISGAGSIRYKGHPQITRHISGVGEIEDNNESSEN